MVIGDDTLDRVKVLAPFIQVTVYAVITEPPVEPGAVNKIDAWPLPAMGLPMTGAPGGVTLLASNVAVTVLAIASELIVQLKPLTPSQPLQLERIDPAFGAAVSVMDVAAP